MDLNSRQYVVSLDMTRTGSIRESFEMRHNDDNELIIELRDSAGIIDLNASGVINATLLVTRKDKVDIPLAGTITPEGRASFKLKRASLEKQGMVEVVAQFYFANDVRISTPTLIFNVLRDPSAGAVGDEGDDRTLIEIILNDAPALLEQLQTAYDELVIQKAAFAQFQTDSETAFSNAQNQRSTDFNADQAARNTAFEDAQTQRATDFNTSQGERATLFNQAQTARQNDYQTWRDAKDTELNQLASDTENSKLAADGATLNASNAAAEALEAAEEATGAVAEVTGAKQSTVKNKTFANLDTRMEELEDDTYKPMQNLITNGNFANGTTGWSGTNGTIAAASNELTFTGTSGTTGTSVISRTSAFLEANVYYTRWDYYLSHPATSVYVENVGAKFISSTTPVVGNWASVSGIDSNVSASTSTLTWVALFNDSANLNKIFKIRNLVIINLTQAFGKGNEPTKEEMDRLLAKYPNSFFDGTVNLTPKLLDDLRYLTSDVQMPMKNEILNGDFLNGISGWQALHSTIAILDANTVRVTGSGSAYEPAIYRSLVSPPSSGDKIYSKYKVRSVDDGCVALRFISGSDSLANRIYNPVVNTWYEMSGLSTGSGSYAFMVMYAEYANATEAIGKRSDYQLVLSINLTKVFGAGNEPSKAQMDALLATYPNSWFDGTVNLAENKRIIPFLLKRLELKADKTQEAWITPTLLNGATASPGTLVQYMKDSMGFVRLRGLVQNVTVGQTVFNLPVGYRPSQNMYFVGRSGGNTVCTILVLTTGNVQVDMYNSYAALDSVTLKVV